MCHKLTRLMNLNAIVQRFFFDWEQLRGGAADNNIFGWICNGFQADPSKFSLIK